MNQLYRDRYDSCHGKFSLGVPFTERFFQLAQSDEHRAAGYIGLITSNSFMKREFGSKLIEEYLPRQDVTHVIDTSGAYIPGHGTPTVILFGRHRAPVGDDVRTVLGTRGEPGTPIDPAAGLVWTSIVQLVDRAGSGSDFVSVSDVPRSTLAKHPWSLQGGAAPAVLGAIHDASTSTLGSLAISVGVGVVTGEDDAYVVPPSLQRRQFSDLSVRQFVEGDDIRDWTIESKSAVLYPQDLKSVDAAPSFAQHAWRMRVRMRSYVYFGQLKEERGIRWFDFGYWSPSKLTGPSITFAEVATHNHFVLDRGGKVFKQTAPVIKLQDDADEDKHLGLLGLLNSSTACFWLQQVCHNKGRPGADVAGADERYEMRYAINASNVERMPIAAIRPLTLAKQLDTLAQQRAATLPAALGARLPLTRSDLDQARADAALLLQQMVAAQDELDWWCYRAYGLIDQDLTHATPPPIALGERAFEIVLARKLAAGEIETTWFARHGSTPITAVPAQWPADYRAVVERRIALIETHPWIGLLERPEYKRRWNQPAWADLEASALKDWLLDRLERPGYWPEPSLQGLAGIAAHAERDADFMAVAQLYTGHIAFDLDSLLADLLQAESVPALAALRYTDSGLRKRADWEYTWEQQRLEDAIDAEIAAAHPPQPGEDAPAHAARIAPLQTNAKRERIGTLPAPPKYTSADFQNTTLWRLRGALDVPKERWLRVPDPVNPGQSLYGWAGWNPAQRVQAIAGAIIEAETRHGVPVTSLIPLYTAIDIELPWVKQWHNTLDPEYGIGMGDYFDQWLRGELQKHGLTRAQLAEWRPEKVVRRARRKVGS